ncbi:MAG: PKD domain-containing protein, partial [Propionibacteriaceae bacterium]|nr:PKD domain-containing protein [Propionibacteriaceae bacterium]
TSDWFAGRIDDVAIYNRALDAATIARQHTIGATGTLPNRAPTPAIAATVSNVTLDVSAAGSSDVDGTVVSAGWDFGDGAVATGTTASHTYADAGTYTVTLTVTDDRGASASTTRSVTVTAPPANVAPVAAFDVTTDALTVAVDGAASADPDGTVASFAWDFGDGDTATGSTASHT